MSSRPLVADFFRDAFCIYSLVLLVSQSIHAQDQIAPNHQVIKAAPTNRQVAPGKHRLTIREPDGSLAKSLRVMVVTAASRDPNVNWQSLLAKAPETLEGGTIELDLSDLKRNVFVLQSDNGIIALSSRRLLMLDEVQLSSYGQLKVRVLQGSQPAAGVPIDVSCQTTSDGMHQVRYLRSTAMTNEQGIATFDRAPPGEALVQVSHESLQQRARQGFISGETTLAHQYVWMDGGQSQELTFGENCRSVSGKLDMPREVPASDMKYCQASLVYYDRQHLSARCLVKPDGTFTCEDAPIGRARLEVFYVITSGNKHFRDAHPVVVAEPRADEPVQDLGRFTIEKRVSSPPPKVSSRKDDLENGHVALNPRGEGPVRWIGLASAQSEERLVLLNAKGEVVAAPEVNYQGGFGGFKGSLKYAAKHQRIYTFADKDEKQFDPQALIALDLEGRVLWRREIAGSTPIIRIEVDPRSGNVWLLRYLDSKGGENLLIYDSEGECIERRRVDATNMAYCATDFTFWMAGEKTVLKVDPISGQELATYKYPVGEMAIGSLVASSDGGVYLVETAKESRFESVNQILKLSSTGQPVASIDLGSHSVFSLVEIGDHLLALSNQERGTFVPSSDHSVLRIKEDLSEAVVIPAKFDWLNALTVNDSEVICLANGRFARITSDGQEIIGDLNMATQRVKLRYGIAVQQKFPPD